MHLKTASLSISLLLAGFIRLAAANDSRITFYTDAGCADEIATYYYQDYEPSESAEPGDCQDLSTLAHSYQTFDTACPAPIDGYYEQFAVFNSPDACTNSDADNSVGPGCGDGCIACTDLHGNGVNCASWRTADVLVDDDNCKRDLFGRCSR